MKACKEKSFNGIFESFFCKKMSKENVKEVQDRLNFWTMNWTEQKLEQKLNEICLLKFAFKVLIDYLP